MFRLFEILANLFTAGEYEELQKKNERLEKRVEKLITNKHELEEKLKNYEIKEMIEKYDYAILVNKGYFNGYVVWNKGRYEEDVKELHVDLLPNTLPQITIVK